MDVFDYCRTGVLFKAQGLRVDEVQNHPHRTSNQAHKQAPECPLRGSSSRTIRYLGLLYLGFALKSCEHLHTEVLLQGSVCIELLAKLISCIVVEIELFVETIFFFFNF